VDVTDRTAAPVAQDRPRAEVFAHTADDYLAFQRYLEDTSGIVLGAGNEALVGSRLTQLMLEHDIASLREMVRALENGANPRLRTAVVDAMTTPETGWFRDSAHFRILAEEILPTLSSSRVRIWSAGCATGQEPYSISMVVQDYLKGHRGRFASGVEIVATDIARAALDEARRGLYCGAATRGLSDEHRRRYLAPGSGDCLSVRQEIRQRVVFREFNLARGLGVLGRVDVIFSRNQLV
jgi:chemotaxis protein methyltransferase CheR